MTESKPRLAVLSFHNSKETKSLLNSAEELGFDPVWIMEQNLTIEMSENGLNVEPESDVLVNRMLLSRESQPIQLLGLSEAVSADTPILNHPKNVLTVLNKISSTAKISNEDGYNVPKSYFADDDAIEDLIAENGEAIQKRSIGTHGSGVARITETDAAISNSLGHYSMTQERVDQDGPARDVRAYVVGDTVVAAMERQSPEDDWRANIARGASADSRSLDESTKDEIVDLCKSFGLDYAGVDLMFDSDGEPHYLEVNPTAGFKGLFDATGINPAPYIVALAGAKIGNKPNMDAVHRLSKSLDDSIPSCRPTRNNTDSPDIGLKIDTYIAGTKTSEKVVSKVDTGSSRTSVDIKLASKLGLGPIKDYVSVRTGSSKQSRKRPIVESTIKLKGIKHTVDVSIEDREHMNYKLILGRDVLEKYTIHPNKR